MRLWHLGRQQQHDGVAVDNADAENDANVASRSHHDKQHNNGNSRDQIRKPHDKNDLLNPAQKDRPEDSSQAADGLDAADTADMMAFASSDSMLDDRPHARRKQAGTGATVQTTTTSVSGDSSSTPSQPSQPARGEDEDLWLFSANNEEYGPEVEDERELASTVRTQARQTIVTRDFLRRTVAECLQAMHAGVNVQSWSLDLLNANKRDKRRRRPRSMLLFLDESCSVLTFKDVVDGRQSIVLIDRIADVRLHPNTDRDTVDLHHVGSAADGVQRFFSLAVRHRSSEDPRHIVIVNVLAESRRTCQICVRALMHLVRSNIINTPRIHTLDRRLRILHAQLCIQAKGDMLKKRDFDRVFASRGLHEFAASLLRSLGGAKRGVEVSRMTESRFRNEHAKLMKNSRLRKLFEDVADTRIRLRLHSVKAMSTRALASFLAEQAADPRGGSHKSPEVMDKMTQRARFVVDNFEPHAELEAKALLSFDGFQAYIYGEDNSIVGDAHVTVTEDMSRPLTDYFISSSHNTFLIGNQVGDRSSVEMYRQVLISGCRCVEIDSWNGADGKPIVTHGRCFCTRIQFRKVIEAIHECAFLTSEYPVILSIENHCNEEQRDIMADIIVDVFGDSLVRDFLEHDRNSSKIANLPSPSMLKRKILIKNKIMPATATSSSEDFVPKRSTTTLSSTTMAGLRTDSSIPSTRIEFDAVPKDASSSAELKQRRNISSAETNVPRRNSSRSDSSEIDFIQRTASKSLEEEVHDAIHENVREPAFADEDDEVESQLTAQKTGAFDRTVMATSVVASYQRSGPSTDTEEATIQVDNLSKLVSYIRPLKFRSFKSAESGDATEMCSLGEKKAFQFYWNRSEEFVKYTSKHIVRVYPHFKRYSSTNFNPQTYWTAGVQMVALNWQTIDDEYLQIHHAFFSLNARSGYLLKPQAIMLADPHYDPLGDDVPAEIPLELSIELLAAQHLSGDISKVCLDVVGLAQDYQKDEITTRPQSDGHTGCKWSPDTALRCNKIRMPSVAIVRLTVEGTSEQCLGRALLPLRSLKAGVRPIFLKNARTPLAHLVVNIKLDAYMPKQHEYFAATLENPVENAEERAALALQLLSKGSKDREADDEVMESATAAQSSKPSRVTSSKEPKIATENTRRDSDEYDNVEDGEESPHFSEEHAALHLEQFISQSEASRLLNKLRRSHGADKSAQAFGGDAGIAAVSEEAGQLGMLGEEVVSRGDDDGRVLVDVDRPSVSTVGSVHEYHEIDDGSGSQRTIHASPFEAQETRQLHPVSEEPEHNLEDPAEHQGGLQQATLEYHEVVAVDRAHSLVSETRPTVSGALQQNEASDVDVMGSDDEGVAEKYATVIGTEAFDARQSTRTAQQGAGDRRSVASSIGMVRRILSQDHDRRIRSEDERLENDVFIPETRNESKTSNLNRRDPREQSSSKLTSSGSEPSMRKARRTSSKVTVDHRLAKPDAQTASLSKPRKGTRNVSFAQAAVAQANTDDDSKQPIRSDEKSSRAAKIKKASLTRHGLGSAGMRSGPSSTSYTCVVLPSELSDKLGAVAARVSLTLTPEHVAVCRHGHEGAYDEVLACAPLHVIRKYGSCGNAFAIEFGTRHTTPGVLLLATKKADHLHGLLRRHMKAAKGVVEAEAR